MTKILFSLFLWCSLLGVVDNSILPQLDQLFTLDLEKKLSRQQIEEMESYTFSLEQKLRVISFNMLFNLTDHRLAPVNRWKKRKNRVIEYIRWGKPDLIGSQELQKKQLEDLIYVLGDDYDFYGEVATGGIRSGEIPAIFYRKDRLELLEGNTYYFSETPEVRKTGPFAKKNNFSLARFRDKMTDREFIVLNTHLGFTEIERRRYEACKLRDFLLENSFDLPIILTGDFNTFPLRLDLDNLPFYDGNEILRIIGESRLINSMEAALYGHIGPISSTNFCPKKKKVFKGLGQPGVILDHIFVSSGIKVIAHGIDPATINGHFLSDHFPVVADLILE